MQSITLIIGVVCLSAFAVAYPQLELVEDQYGEVFQLVPLQRHRRENCGGRHKQKSGSVYGQADNTDPGRVILGARNTPINNDNHRLDTHVYASDNIRHHTPLTVGGEANYVHKPSQNTFGVSAVHTERMGTDLKAAGRYNIHQDPSSNVNVEAFASQHLGGRQGSQPIDYGVMLNFKKDI